MSITVQPSLAELLRHGKVHRNFNAAPLVEIAISRGEARLASNGALVAYTGRTGRSPKDKFTVKDELTADRVHWGAINQPFEREKFDALYDKVVEHLRDRDLFVQDLFAGADPQYRLPVRVITEHAWQSLFARQLFIRPTAQELQTHQPDFLVVAAPEVHADPLHDGTNSGAFILVNFTRRMILIGGTAYAGEIKKCIFGVMNFLMPPRDVFPMHCSANIGKDGMTALFFGLSGTGKTTLSADSNRRLIGDDEHGWSQQGIFNFEGGCYAKCIRLSQQKEPQIWNAIRFGCVLENVVLQPETNVPNYDDESVTENTRAAYPVEFIDNAEIPGVGGHPKHVVFLTADAFGVLPPISRLNPEQAMYHFLSGYTAKVAGTEAGLGKEPLATFSTCFASPFLPLRPNVYAEMLGRRLREHKASCWLINTGWQGGKFGVGRRMDLNYTRAMVRAAVDDRLNDAEFEVEPAFGLTIPKAVPDVPRDLLAPRNAWADKLAYDRTAQELSQRFHRNFEKFEAPEEVRAAGPKPAGK